MSVDRVYLRRLRILGVVEGISTLLLFFVAMPLKYFADMPMAVTIVGSMHGFLFIALVVALAIAVSKVPITPTLAALGVVGAIFPFGPFVVDGWLARVGEGDGATTGGAGPSDRRDHDAPVLVEPSSRH